MGAWDLRLERVEVIRRPRRYSRGIWYFAAVEAEKGFRVLPRHWVAERTFAWLSCQRRLNRDYDFLPATTATCILIASLRLFTRRLVA